MDELHEYCARMLGDGEAAGDAARSALVAGGEDRIARLSHAVRNCRARRGTDGEDPAQTSAWPDGDGSPATTLATIVAGEIAAASARLAQRQREALALRDGLGCSHREIAALIGIEAPEVPSLLGRSRLRLRAQLRGAEPDRDSCPERERTIATATLRRDHEPVPAADDDWLVHHLGHCEGCVRVHCAMLEGSARYRGWRLAPAASVTS
jgi:hypothetical protein